MSARGGSTGEAGSWELWALRALLTALLGLTLALLLLSLHWPLIHDAPLMHYIAWRIGEGAVPYRDVVDMNMPGTYLVHMGALAVLGESDAAWRTLDALWLAATCGALTALCRPFGWRPALIASLLTASYHLAAGPARMGQRDFLIVAPLLLAAHLVATYRERGARSPILLVIAGAAVGMAVAIKPLPLLLLLPLAGAAVYRERSSSTAPSWPVPLAALALGAALPLLGVATWLATHGAIEPWWQMTLGFLIDVYVQLGAWHPTDGPQPNELYMLVMIALGALAVRLWWRERRLGARQALIGVGALYGIAHYVLQGKGFTYHAVPLVAFASALVATRMTLPGLRRWPVPGAAMILGVGLLVVVSALPAIRTNGFETLTRVGLGRLAAMERDLAICAASGDPVQVIGSTSQGLHALLRLHLRQPSPFLYDFSLLERQDTAVVQGYRAEFLSALTSDPPSCVLVEEDGWPTSGYERLGRFPQLVALLEDRYELRVQGNDFRIYGRKALTTLAPPARVTASDAPAPAQDAAAGAPGDLESPPKPSRSTPG